jgi:chromosome segregation ATPase
VDEGGEQADANVLAAALGRASAQLDEARAAAALADGLRERLANDVRRLERRLADVEAERDELLEKLNHRDRLLTQIFGSRSWRWTQGLRRRLGRP